MFMLNLQPAFKKIVLEGSVGSLKHYVWSYLRRNASVVLKTKCRDAMRMNFIAEMESAYPGCYFVMENMIVVMDQMKNYGKFVSSPFPQHIVHISKILVPIPTTNCSKGQVNVGKTSVCLKDLCKFNTYV